MTSIDYDSLIPNNVDLAGDRRLQRALESWQPKFIEWWKALGPVAFQDDLLADAGAHRLRAPVLVLGRQPGVEHVGGLDDMVVDADDLRELTHRGHPPHATP